MASKQIDLKIDRADGPSEPMSMPEYPTLHISSHEDHGLPDEGSAVFHFKTSNRSTTEEKEGGTHYSCTIEVQKMSNIKGGKADKADEGESETPAEDAAEGGIEEETPPPKKKRSPAVAAALSGEGNY